VSRQADVPVEVAIEVNSAYYESLSSGAPTYTFIGAPIISSMDAYSGLPGAPVPVPVTVNGSNFDYGNAKVYQVQFCKGPGSCTGALFNVLNDTTIHVIVPTGLVNGTYAVTVASPGGATNADR
jgi:hypothetical protein